ncbi:MAG TPA: DUF6084 family protein [Mycobacteriales bacterium]|nr:DUF6084 family protein [Mycobacteriales bacterium]
MAELVFDVTDIRVEPYAAAPTLTMRLRISETTGVKVHTILLRCQIRIEPLHRKYTDGEAARLVELFGERPRWAETLKPMQFTTVAVLVPAFTGSTEIDVPILCTYDFDVSTAKYFHALEIGEIPLLVLYSGTFYTPGPTGYAVGQVPWHKESNYRLPVSVWRAMMDRYFPNTAWIRISRDALDALSAYRARRALPSWEHVIDELLAAQDEEVPG